MIISNVLSSNDERSVRSTILVEMFGYEAVRRVANAIWSGDTSVTVTSTCYLKQEVQGIATKHETTINITKDDKRNLHEAFPSQSLAQVHPVQMLGPKA